VGRDAGSQRDRPARDAEATLGATLDALTAQTYPAGDAVTFAALARGSLEARAVVL